MVFKPVVFKQSLPVGRWVLGSSYFLVAPFLWFLSRPSLSPPYSPSQPFYAITPRSLMTTLHLDTATCTLFRRFGFTFNWYQTIPLRKEPTIVPRLGSPLHLLSRIKRLHLSSVNLLNFAVRLQTQSSGIPTSPPHACSPSLSFSFLVLSMHTAPSATERDSSLRAN